MGSQRRLYEDLTAAGVAEADIPTLADAIETLESAGDDFTNALAGMTSDVQPELQPEVIAELRSVLARLVEAVETVDRSTAGLEPRWVRYSYRVGIREADDSRAVGDAYRTTFRRADQPESRIDCVSFARAGESDFHHLHRITVSTPDGSSTRTRMGQSFDTAAEATMWLSSAIENLEPPSWDGVAADGVVW